MPRFAAPDGTLLHYADAGPESAAGVPILCLSGLTRNGTDFDYVAPHMADRRLVRLDYRGRGRSDWADPETYDIATEARDALALLDHLDIGRAAILGTSRGGLIAMLLAATAKDRLAGVCLVDIGPEIAAKGLDAIRGYVGRNPAATDHAAAARSMAVRMTGFDGVPHERWLEEARKHYVQTPDGLRITYDPGLARTLEPPDGPPPDLWPLFDALDGLPLGLIRGANSDLLAGATADEMRRRRPDMVFADVPDRGHVPFLDEPAALAGLEHWTARL